MRILQVLHSHNYGGAENHALGLLQLERTDGHTVACACPAGSWLAEKCAAVGIETFPLAMHGMADLVSYWQLRRIAHRWKPDVAHAHLARASQYVGIALAGLPVARVSTCHATTTHRHMRRFKDIIAVSNAVKRNLLAHDYAEQAIHVVHNGIADVPHLPRLEARAALGIMPDAAHAEFAVACIGRFVECKGQDLLVEAVHRTPPNSNLRIYFIGDAETPFGAKVRTAAANDPRIHFLGYRDKVPALLSAFDLVCAPSRREAMSLTLIEASAATLAIVASNVGGIPEILRDGETGILTPSDDPAAIANALSALQHDAAKRARMGQAARTHYEAHFTAEQMLRGTLATYQNAISRIA